MRLDIRTPIRALLVMLGASLAAAAQVDGDWELPRVADELTQPGPASGGVGGATAGGWGAPGAPHNQGQQPLAGDVRHLRVDDERVTARRAVPVDGAAGAVFAVLAGADSGAPGLVLDRGVVTADGASVRVPRPLADASVLVVVVAPDGGSVAVSPWRVAARGEPSAGRAARASEDGAPSAPSPAAAKGAPGA